jgi:MurNAc alpha-1-phosphate uridylyltransferase
MRALILAAGRGERMRPLTDLVPKPLLEAGGRTLIEWQIERLARAGLRELVVNVSHLAGQIETALGDGSRHGVHIAYSREPAALETAGGVAQALDLLGDAPFVAVNADIYCEYDYASLLPVLAGMAGAGGEPHAHLVLVPNPSHHPLGDFVLGADGRIANDGALRLTFSGIGAYRPAAFRHIVRGSRAALAPLLRGLAERGELHGERFDGHWVDVGTPQRLDGLRSFLIGRA